MTYLKGLAEKVSRKEIKNSLDIDSAVKDSLKELGYVKVNEEDLKDLLKLFHLIYSINR
jgi:hypothetical protein